MNKHLPILFGLMMILLSTGFVFGASVRIIVREDSMVDGEQILIRDIAILQGETETAARIGRLSLGLSPDISAVRSISLRKLKLVIAAAGFQLSRVMITMPASVYVRRQSQQADDLALKEAIEAELRAKFGSKGMLIQFKQLQIPEIGFIPVGEVTTRIETKAVRNPFERFFVPIDIIVNGQRARRVSVSVELEGFADVLVSKHEIPVNQEIKEADLIKDTRRLVRPITDYLTDFKQVKGIKSSRLIRAGDAVSNSFFVKSYVIKNGDTVKIEAMSDKLRLSVRGTALNSGRIGERIAVKNNESKQIFQALIIDKGIVRVRF